jgi:L,D-peptidoglycan transpeptidase YkuD (ErfK/YbiS/YcfS/YnhG family)
VAMRRPRGDERDSRANLILLGSVGGLLLLVVVGLIALAFASPRTPVPAAAPTPRVASSAATATPATTTADATRTVAATPTPTPIAPQKPIASPAKTRPAAPKTIPERMARLLPGSTQIVIVTGARLGSNTGTLRIFNLDGGRWKQVLSAVTRMGTNGLANGATRREGSRTTPTGTWRMGDFLFGWHPSAPTGTKMAYRATDSGSWWSYQHDDTYNTWVQSSGHVDGEHLVDVRIQYEFAASTGYNAPPNERVIGRGSAIFIHVFDPPDYHNGFSAGCIGISRDDMIRVFHTLDPARKPTCAVGTEAPGPQSIYSY